MTAYQKIKESIKTATNETLFDIYNELEDKFEVEEMVVRNAVEGELEDRGLIRWNEETFEYEVVK